MDKVKLRGHHIEFIVRRALAGQEGPEMKKAASEHLINIYGKEYVSNLEAFEKKIKPDTLIEVVAGEDDICNNMDCPYFSECESGDYQALSYEMMKRVPAFLIALPIIIARTMSKQKLLKEDAAIVKEYGLKTGDKRPLSYFLKIREKEYERLEDKCAR
jgi:hypothetical protein